MRLGALIGRERVLEEMTKVLSRDEPLLTILGPPGIGKTRVAQRFWETEKDKYTAGGWFCDLIEVQTQAGLVHAVATLLGTTEHLVEALASRGPTLLILDNFEQLVVSCTHLVREWCQVSPRLRVLVTSRERLGVQGEHVIELPPLTSDDGVRLFSARSASIGGDLGTDPKVIRDLVRRLDGIPLAIELAAARTRVLTPKDLAARLEARFALLTQLPRETEGRHRTLESAIDWSWNMLTAEEQVALAQCSVFAGGFTVSAAESVLTGEGIVDRVTALRDKSLIHATTPGRFSLYVSIREYASKKLASLGDDTALRQRHAQYYAMAAKPFSEARTFHGVLPDGELRTRLTGDQENLLAALTFAHTTTTMTQDAAEIDGELANAVTLLQAAPVETCHHALDRAIAMIDPETSRFISLRSRLLLARQSLLNSLGRFAESRTDLIAVLASPLLPAGMRALALVMQGIQLRYQALARDAWNSHSLAEHELSTLDLPRMQAMNLACMGRLQCDFANTQLGRQYNERARSICVHINDRWLEGLVLGNLGQLEQELGNFAFSAELLGHALERFREASEPQYFAIYSAALADLCYERGRIDEARASYARAAEYLGSWPTHRNTVLLYGAWGSLEAAHGDASVADAHFARARRSSSLSSATVRVALRAHEASLGLRRAVDQDAERLDWMERLRAWHGGEGQDAHVVAESMEVRFALRILARSLNPASRTLTLNLGPECTWFAVGQEERVDLQRRGSLRRILHALALQHTRERGHSLDARTLVASGWPNERLLADAASKRLRVAVATLRKLGLRDLLITRDDGYALDPAATVLASGDI